MTDSTALLEGEAARRIRVSCPDMSTWAVLEVAGLVDGIPGGAQELERVLAAAARGHVENPPAYILSCARRMAAEHATRAASSPVGYFSPGA